MQTVKQATMLAQNNVSGCCSSWSRSAVAISCQPPVRSYGSSLAGTRLSASHRRALASARKLQAAVPTRLIIYASSGPAANNAAGPDDLPLWRHLREQEGFSNDTISKLQKKRKGLGTQYSPNQVQDDLAPNIAALRKEGLTTGTLKLIFLKRPDFLYATHDTFTSSLPVLRDFAEQLDSDKLRPYDARLTRLGAALRDYPGSSGYLLTFTGSYITATQQLLQDELDVSSTEFAAVLFKKKTIIIGDPARAQRMVQHLLDKCNGDKKKVKTIALGSRVLSLEPTEFHLRMEGRASALDITVEAALEIICQQPSLADHMADGIKPKLEANMDIIARLIQAAEGVPADAPLQPEHLQGAKALVVKKAVLQVAKASTIHANWDYLRREGQPDARIWAAFNKAPTLMTCHLEGTTQQLKADWIRQELGLGFAEFITSYPHPARDGLAKMAMRAHFLKARGEWNAIRARGMNSLLSVLTMSAPNFCKRLDLMGCTKEQLADFERDWRRSLAALRWGVKSDRSRRVEPTDA